VQDLDEVEATLRKVLGREGMVGADGAERGPPEAIRAVPWDKHRVPLCKTMVDREAQHDIGSLTYKKISPPIRSPQDCVRKIQVRRGVATHVLTLYSLSLRENAVSLDSR
jgi:hypothetical protein